MFYNILLHLILIFYVWNSNNFVDAEIDLKDEFMACDYARFESHLEALKTGIEMIHSQLKVLENKVDNIPKNLQNTEIKILARTKEHEDEIIYIKETLKGHDGLLEGFTEKLKNVENKLQITATKSDQKELSQYVQSYINNIEANTLMALNKGKDLVCTTSSYPTSCADFNTNYCSNNKCRIFNKIYGQKPFYVSCDNQTDGGGWTVIQRRINGSVDFYRNWSEYKMGFGNIEGEFFIGLDKLHALTTALQPVELLIQLQDFNNTLTYAKYDEFIVEDELENYKLLKVGKYSGNATDNLSQHQGHMFITKDRDNDISTKVNCAEDYKSGWWFRKCFYSNLNGRYYGKIEAATASDGICWNVIGGCKYSLKFVQMMIRPKKI
ncbi:techylectin-5A-like [Lucilia sericata]|uniref:techylectin-5A-like n=1 Tax=Lucilia sericata TaxID=13632 RepID=UPI0018A87DBE|nr:techylectin-5A-like [Lucilia sericata]